MSRKLKYTEAVRKLFEVMDGREDIAKVVFNRNADSFDVIDTDGNIHLCLGSEFRYTDIGLFGKENEC